MDHWSPHLADVSVQQRDRESNCNGDRFPQDQSFIRKKCAGKPKKCPFKRSEADFDQLSLPEKFHKSFNRAFANQPNPLTFALLF
jgi:hypothetical protein